MTRKTVYLLIKYMKGKIKGSYSSPREISPFHTQDEPLHGSMKPPPRQGDDQKCGKGPRQTQGEGEGDEGD